MDSSGLDLILPGIALWVGVVPLLVAAGACGGAQRGEGRSSGALLEWKSMKAVGASVPGRRMKHLHGGRIDNIQARDMHHARQIICCWKVFRMGFFLRNVDAHGALKALDLFQ